MIELTEHDVEDIKTETRELLKTKEYNTAGLMIKGVLGLVLVVSGLSLADAIINYKMFTTLALMSNVIGSLAVIAIVGYLLYQIW